MKFAGLSGTSGAEPRTVMKHATKTLALGVCITLLGACSKTAVYTTESFASDSPFELKVVDDAATACESARRSLLAPGLPDRKATGENVKGRKGYNSADNPNTFIEMNVVCASDIRRQHGVRQRRAEHLRAEKEQQRRQCRTERRGLDLAAHRPERRLAGEGLGGDHQRQGLRQPLLRGGGPHPRRHARRRSRKPSRFPSPNPNPFRNPAPPTVAAPEPAAVQAAPSSAPAQVQAAPVTTTPASAPVPTAPQRRPNWVPAEPVPTMVPEPGALPRPCRRAHRRRPCPAGCAARSLAGARTRGGAHGCAGAGPDTGRPHVRAGLTARTAPATPESVPLPTNPTTGWSRFPCPGRPVASIKRVMIEHVRQRRTCRNLRRTLEKIREGKWGG